MEPEPEDLDAMQGPDLVPDRKPWDRLPTESQKAFDAFSAYRDLERRSFKSIAEKLSCSPQNIFQWSSRHNWRGRVDAWDVEQDRQQRIAFARSRVRMKERHRQLAVAMLGIAATGVRELQVRVEAGLRLDLSPEQLALLTRTAAELERSALGMDQEHAPTTISVFFGEHKYPHEQAASGDAEDDLEWKSMAVVEAEQYAMLDEAGRAAMDRWRDPPKPKELTS